MKEQLDPKEVARNLATGYRELTFAAVSLGIVQGVILNLSFVYAALKLGFSITGSTVAAIMGYALLTGVLKKGTSIENNINQTVASGINMAGTGVVFTLPALFMLNAKWIADGEPGLEFSVWPLILGGISGAILGTVLIIPLRKQMIEVERLRFPSGVAVTTIIRSGASGLSKAKLLGIGILIGGALMGVVVCFPAIISAFRSLAGVAKTSGSCSNSDGAQELPLKAIIIGTIIGISLFFVASLMTEGVTVLQAVIGSIIGTLWLAVAGLIVAQATGLTDISPVSGMALISVTLMMFLYSNNVAASMVVGVAVCVATNQGADMMQDLKTGFMLGAKPIKQQIVQFSTTWIGALLAIGAIYVLWKSCSGGQGGFGVSSQGVMAEFGKGRSD